MTLAKQHIEDYEVLTQYIVELNNAYISAKSYLGIGRNFCLTAIIAGWSFIYSGHTTLTQILLSVWHRKVLKAYCRGFFLPVSWETRKRAFWKFSPVVTEGRSCPRLHVDFVLKSFSLITSSHLHQIRSYRGIHMGANWNYINTKRAYAFSAWRGAQHVKNACEARHNPLI